ncbi:PREDICTED: E3 ubiquitin/ISG15 ligase TRIM25 [Pygoscelis adeliae]|uniref:E3 ubiquitin/ISG15 ligase TRIM25 n=1 Tax=Pygoscelis adeliae TaxID=9238 RepID=UPI0004F4EC3F|nr:PREDICTED: E3 ubiquitin/ISG15 ligase TRIM25 [Pygoscelis adeliae]
MVSTFTAQQPVCFENTRSTSAYLTFTSQVNRSSGESSRGWRQLGPLPGGSRGSHGRLASSFAGSGEQGRAAARPRWSVRSPLFVQFWEGKGAAGRQRSPPRWGWQSGWAFASEITHFGLETKPETSRAQRLRRSTLKKKLTELHSQSERAARAMSTVKTNQSQAAEAASRKKDLIRSEFSEIKALIEERENQTLKVIADEEKRVCNKFDYIYGVLGSKKNEIQSLRDQIEMALTEDDDILFLKRAAALQRMSTKDAFVPVIEMDQNLIHSTYQSAINLKDTVKLAVTLYREKKAEAKLPPGKTKPPPAASLNKISVGKKPLGPQHIHKEKNLHQTQATLQVEADTKEKKKPVKVAPATGTLNAAAAVSTKELIDSFLKKPREELLQYAANITLDYNTAHNKVILSERYTRMSVSDTPLNYNYHPQRFTDCSQVLGFQCFKRGIHYWEVELQQNNFCGVGICYGSMDRQGPESRLGRNSSSWCIEWFNSKISCWHNDVEKCLPNVKTTKVGVLLHCEGGFVMFMAVGEKHNLIYKFKTQFTEALYPAFWLFSSGTVLSLCQVKQ